MTDDMSNPARREARQRLRDHDQRLRDRMRDTAELSWQEKLERHAEAVAPRSRPVDALNRHHEQHGRLLTGFEPALKKERDKLEASARSFTYNRQMERLIEWEAKGDPRLDKIDPVQRISLGFYRRNKDAARQLGLPTGKPKDDGNGW